MAPDGVPHLVAAARVEPRRRLVEQQQPGRPHQGRPQVEPPPHAARVRLHQPAARLGQAHQLQDLLGRGRRLLPPLAVQAGHHRHVLPARHHLLDRGRLAGQPDHAAHRHGVLHHVVAVDAQRPRVGRDQRRHHADERGLAGAVGPEDGHGLPGRQGQGQLRERLDLPEALGEAVGLYQGVHARPSFRRWFCCRFCRFSATRCRAEPGRRKVAYALGAASGEGLPGSGSWLCRFGAAWCNTRPRVIPWASRR